MTCLCSPKDLKSDDSATAFDFNLIPSSIVQMPESRRSIKITFILFSNAEGRHGVEREARNGIDRSATGQPHSTVSPLSSRTECLITINLLTSAKVSYTKISTLPTHCIESYPYTLESLFWRVLRSVSCSTSTAYRVFNFRDVNTLDLLPI